MTRTPPTISLIGITLTVLALATGSWLSKTAAFQPPVHQAPEMVVDVEDGDQPDGEPWSSGYSLPDSC